MKRCDSGDYAVKYGEWVEVVGEGNRILYSFKATSDMCESILARFLVMRAGIEPGTSYRLKRRRQ